MRSIREVYAQMRLAEIATCHITRGKHCDASQLLPAGLTNANLLALSTAVYETLPRELRDMIYLYLYDVMEPWDFLATTTTIKPESLAGITETLNSWPRVIQPRVVHHAFAQEVGQTFYEEYEGLTVVDARKIDEILNTDFFKLDVRLNSCVLPALTVCIRLDGVKDTFFDPSRQLLPTLADPKDSHTVPSADLFDCFAPLLVDKQRLKRNFKPVIHLYNPRLFDGCMSWVGGVDEAAIRDAIELFIPMLQTCKPVVAALRKRCQADVKIVIGFGDATDLVVQEAQMDYDVEE